MNVTMTNPKLPGDERAVTSQEAFDDVWSKDGWELVDEEPAEPPAARSKPAAKSTSKPAQASGTATKKAEAT